MYVFVYGTLKKGECNNRLLEHSQFISSATIRDFTAINTPSFPYAIRTREAKMLHGEVYKITPTVLRILDSLEGYPNHYDRGTVDIVGKSCYIYFLPDSPRVQNLKETYGTTYNWKSK